jgi:adenine-specific DNA-methyltransferase
VQLGELINKKKNKIAYDFVKNELGKDKPTIFDITQERIIRSAKKIQEDNKKSKDLFNKNNPQDFGFKIFETIPNYKGVWEDYLFEAAELDDEQQLFNSDNLTDEDLKVLLTTWKTNDNIALTQSLTAINLDGYIGFYFAKKHYLLNTGFKTKNLKKLLEEVDSNKDFNPANIIAFGHNFESKNLREIAENIKSYANKKHIDIDFITRY